MDFTFRIAEPSDAEAISNLVNAAYRPLAGAEGWTHESHLVAGQRTTSSQIEEMIARNHSFILTAFQQSDLVGCVHVENDGKNCYIGMLSVNPAVQGGGIGKRLLAYAESHAGEVFAPEKFTLVVISTRTELISYYLRRGYTKTGMSMEYPLSAGAGMPMQPGLRIEVLEKPVDSTTAFS